MELSARFADENDLEECQRAGYQIYDTAKGKLMLPRDGVRTAEIVKFDLSQFLWMSMLQYDGIYKD